MSYEHIFDELEISTEPFAHCELKGACDLGLGWDASATLHYILAGQGEIKLTGRPPVHVSRGSFVLVPALQSHALRSFGANGDPMPQCKPAELRLARLLASSPDGDDAQLTALCAHLRVGIRGVSDIIDLVREPLIETVSSSHAVQPALTALLREISAPRLGSRAMIRALLMQCVIEMLRKRLTMQDSALHWMAALTDPTVWNALRAMLDAPGEAHSVESLADRVGMSRSAFAKRFADAYGSGPMDLLRDLRVRQAGTMLCTTDLPVKRIAELVGFSSRSAFTRMFESRTGQSPSDFRNTRQNAGTEQNE